MMNDMRERFHSIYMDSSWIGLLARFVLILTGMLLLSWCGGLPPWAWRSLFRVMPQIPSLWAAYGWSMLMPLAGLLLLSALLLVAWIALFLLSIHVIHSWRQEHQELQRFNEEVGAAHALSGAVLETQSDSSSVSQQPVGASTGRQRVANNNFAQVDFPQMGLHTAPRLQDAVAEKAPLYTSKLAKDLVKTKEHDRTRGELHLPVYSRKLSTPRPHSNGRTGNTRGTYLDIRTGLDVGIKRRGSPNEDSLSASKNITNLPTAPRPTGLFIVADGMGGHGNGSEASQLALRAMQEYVLGDLRSGVTDVECIKALLIEGVQHANQSVYERNQQQHTQMGTTMTAALLWGSSVYVVNVGDSRAYLYRESSGLSRVTQDHSVVAGLVEIGAISDDDVYTHPQRNEILRALGNKPTVDVDCFTKPARVGDVLLLCSDGLWEMVRDSEIDEIVRTCAPYASPMCAMLIRAALNRGGKDNISVITICIREA